MKLYTKFFGETEYDESMVILFEYGLPGFPDAHRFILIDGGDDTHLFTWLQCIDDEDAAFALIDIYQVIPHYNPTVEAEVIEALGDMDEHGLDIYNIVVIPEDPKDLRVNLKAPVVINLAARRGVQAIVSNEEYSIRHYIFNELEQMNAEREDVPCESV